MKWWLWELKILLLLRIKQQDKSTLSHQIYQEGKIRGWAGLGSEVTEICKALNIPDANENILTKTEVKSAVFNHHYRHIHCWPPGLANARGFSDLINK